MSPGDSLPVNKAEDEEAQHLLAVAHRKEYCGMDGSHRKGDEPDPAFQAGCHGNDEINFDPWRFKSQTHRMRAITH